MHPIRKKTNLHISNMKNNNTHEIYRNSISVNQINNIIRYSTGSSSITRTEEQKHFELKKH